MTRKVVLWLRVSLTDGALVGRKVLLECDGSVRRGGFGGAAEARRRRGGVLDRRADGNGGGLVGGGGGPVGRAGGRRGGRCGGRGRGGSASIVILIAFFLRRRENVRIHGRARERCNVLGGRAGALDRAATSWLLLLGEKFVKFVPTSRAWGTLTPIVNTQPTILCDGST